MASQTHWPMCELLMRHGVEWSQARSRSISTLRYWSLEEVETVLNKIQRPSPEYRLFQSTDVEPTGLPSNPEDRSAFQRWWPSLYRQRDTWIAPPRALVEQSARDGLPLCVNVNGEWSLRSDGYVALSHVWVEGLQRVEEHGGVEKTKINKVFELMERAGLESKWIWTDVLVIPGSGKPTSSLADELLVTELINSMPTVYGMADAVLVIDATVVQLHSTDILDTAVALCCGRWATRVWTYQEIKLASRAVVVTATGGVEFADIIQRLTELDVENKQKYHSMYLWAAIMGKSDKVRLTIRDLIEACADRSSGVDVDYARALFPVLGLTWTSGMTREQGMEQIYRSFPKDAKLIAPFAGSPRMRLFPGWAPSYLKGLEGVSHPDLTYEPRGLRGKWSVLKITGWRGTTMPRYGKIGLNLQVEDENPNVQCTCGPDEPPEVLDAVEKMIKNKRGWILSVKSFAEPDVEWARSVLIAEEAVTSAEDGLELAIHCSATMSVPQRLEQETKSLLMRHWNPNVDLDLVNGVKYVLYRQEEHSLPANILQQDGESLLHVAVRNGDVEEVRKLSNDTESVTTFDSRGYTPLHTAAARGSPEILTCLLAVMKDIEIRTTSHNKDTPLTLAATSGMAASIDILLDHGAEMESRNSNGNTALMCASYECHTDAVATLLDRGADPNARNSDGNGESALILASGRNGRGVAVMKLLVDGGADVNATHKGFGWTPLLKAAEMGGDAEVKFLLSVDANPNVTDHQGLTPLAYTITHAQEDAVRHLLEKGANSQAILHDGLRPIHLAAECPNYKIMQILLDDGVDLDVNVRAAKSVKSRAPLHMVALKGPVTTAKLLLENGANRNAADDDGLKPLDLAVSRADPQMVGLLRSFSS